MLWRSLSRPAAPVALLALVSVLSLAARGALLGQPCQSPCHRATQHTLIFDEAYYVNAARVIAGLRPPTGSHYAGAPAGTDPNAEHPQLVKLIMAGSIELFGDGPLAWRIGSLIFGSLAILGMFALVRAAGGGRWAALGASTLMACDNLLLVHGRIGTLDVYAVAAMIWGVALYLRGRVVLAGLVLGIGAACKLVDPYAVLVLALLELARLAHRRRECVAPEGWGRRPALGRWLACSFTGAGVFLGLLGMMDRFAATPYDDANAKLITGGPFAHLAHMISYAAHQTSLQGPSGIASYPWQWLFDLSPITYLRVNASLPGQQLGAIHPVSKFIGMISPPILLLTFPALALGAYRLLRTRRVPAEPRPPGAPVALPGGVREAAGQVVPASVPAEFQMAVLGLAWFLGTWIPFEALSLLDSRTSYTYYMVVVMPGIYIAVTYLIGTGWCRRGRLARGCVLAWGVAVAGAVVLMYPFTPVF